MALAECDLNDAAFRRLSDAVYRHCGINLHDGKRELVRARVARQLRGGGYGSASEYLDRVLGGQHDEEFTALIDSMSTNQTSFFREERHFVFLRSQFLPALIAAKARLNDRRIRGWSAGCSSGEEAYSLAITLREAVNGHGPWDVRVLATDISTRVLRAAREGAYEPERVRPVAADLRARYFTAERSDEGTLMRVRPELAEWVRFRHLNLMEPWPFTGPFDFIFCRNVMIYFDKPTQQRLVNRFHDCLEPGGMLFTGHSESLTGIVHRFKYVEPTVYRKSP